MPDLNPSLTRNQESPREKYLPFLLHTLLVILLMSWSWRRWIGLEGDGGWNLYTFWRVSEGQVLYRDITTAFGPFSIYFSALSFKIFGASLTTLAVVSAVLITLMAQMIYRIFAWLSVPRDGLVASACFLLLFAFSQYTIGANYNLVTPYKFEALHGSFLLIAIVYLFVNYFSRGGHWRLFLAGLALGAAFTTCAEIAVAAGLATGLWFAIPLISRGRLPRTARAPLSLFVVGTLAIPAAFILLLWAAQGFPLVEAISRTFSSVLSPAGNPEVLQSVFYRHIMGTDDLHNNIRTMALSAGGYLLAALTSGALAWATRKLSRRNGILLGLGILAAAYFLVFLPFLQAPPLVPSPFWEFLFRGLPVFTAAACLLGLWLAVKRKLGPEKYLIIAIWAGLAFVLLLRVIFRVRLPQYGFFVAMPAALLLVWAFTSAWPRWLNRKNWNGHIVQAIFLGFTLAVVLVYFENSSWIYRLKNLPVGSGADQIFALDPRVAVNDASVARVAAWIEANTPLNAIVLVLPDGLIINYLTRRPFPGRTTMSYVGYVVLGEEVISRPWREKKADYVVLLKRDSGEFGVPPFGTSPAYGAKTMEWVESHYLTEHEDFTAKIYRRNSAIP